eukprot:4866311-Amphidinium_carterae.2
MWTLLELASLCECSDTVEFRLPGCTQSVYDNIVLSHIPLHGGQEYPHLLQRLHTAMNLLGCVRMHLKPKQLPAGSTVQTAKVAAKLTNS